VKLQAWVATLAPDGTERWSRVFGTADHETASAVAVSVDGEVYVGGNRSGSEGILWVQALQP
jgi:hypothetical protein